MLSWFGKGSSNSFLVASSFFATVATSSMRNSKILALARLIKRDDRSYSATATSGRGGGWNPDRLATRSWKM
jgi:hypothetical protein